MAEFLAKVKDFIAMVGQKALDLVNLNFDAFWAGIIIFGLALVIIIVVIVSIACGVKSKKKKQAALEKAKAEAAKKKDMDILQQAAEKENDKQDDGPVVEESAPQPAPAPTPAPVASAVEKEEPKPQPQPATENEPAVKKEEPQPAPAPTPAPAVEKEETKPQTQPAPAVVATKEEPKPAKRVYSGRWFIELKSAGEFMAKLVASNGELMLASEIYSSEEGARSGISTIIKWVEEGSFVIYQDKKKNYYYKLKTSGNRLICVGEIYKSEEQCLKAVESVKKIAKISPISHDIVEGNRYVDYKPVPFTEDVKGLKGKWRVETTEEGKFSARLYASNGQLMISTEEVASRKTALNAIEAVKKNSIEGNFIVDKDKFGRFYYKLRNSQKSVICIGEAYDSLDACTKALESVRRFAVNSVVVPE